ncbi:MAG: topoisomerase C-terminal repeat-containing protein [Bacilli bacterium]|nr:topoisomerase C-terminal repeat-containing protein [Bacilli bacterium]
MTKEKLKSFWKRSYSTNLYKLNTPAAFMMVDGRTHLHGELLQQACNESENGCSFSLPKTLLKKKLSVTSIKALCEKNKTSQIKGFENKAGKKFDAVLELDDQKKFKFNFNS